MPKRKRESNAAASTSTGDRALDVEISRLNIRVDQGVFQVRKALGLARGFERQKLGRRQKAASNQPKQLLKLREEVIVLKQLDLGGVAERQFLKRLGRVKRVAETEVFKKVCKGREVGTGGSRGEAEGNVVARLMSSNPVKECLPGMVESVLQVLGLEDGKTEKSVVVGEKDRSHPHVLRNELTREEGDEWSGSDLDVESVENMSIDDEYEKNDRNQYHASMSHNQNSEDNTDNSREFSGFSPRVATSSDVETENEGSKSDDQKNGIRKDNSQITPKRRSPSRSFSPPSQRNSNPKSTTATNNNVTKPFLPSLMMAGYYSGSDSGSDVDEDPLNDSNKPRKNRRGQRARQKIAEAKFGAGAKHLASQKQDQKQKGGRNAGWDARKGATANDVDGKERFRGKGRVVRGPTGANGDVLGARGHGKNSTAKGISDGPMHPSWEAAKKRKEQTGGGKISIDPNKGGGMGKKITFD